MQKLSSLKLLVITLSVVVSALVLGGELFKSMESQYSTFKQPGTILESMESYPVLDPILTKELKQAIEKAEFAEIREKRKLFYCDLAKAYPDSYAKLNSAERAVRTVEGYDLTIYCKP